MVKRMRPSNDRAKPVHIIFNPPQAHSTARGSEISIQQEQKPREESYLSAGKFNIDSGGGIDWTKWLFWRVPAVLAF